jgi:hypothetical protein
MIFCRCVATRRAFFLFHFIFCFFVQYIQFANGRKEGRRARRLLRHQSQATLGMRFDATKGHDRTGQDLGQKGRDKRSRERVLHINPPPAVYAPK